jgi:Mrp family chromosome partitioning ATPase
MNSIERQTLWLEPPPPLRQHYEAHAFATLALLWRRKGIVLGSFLLTLLIATPTALFMSNRYTADVVIQARLARDDQLPQPGRTAPPAVTIDAASMIETETRMIRSRTTAQRVAQRLDLTKDPAFEISYPLANRAMDMLASLWPWSKRTPDSTTPSAEALIAVQLMRRLSVTNDPRSYLITISDTSLSPELSARIANAFAEEYLRTRIEAAARRDFSELSAIYGPKHPLVLSAQAKLEDAATNLRISSNDQVVTVAEPIALPSGPNRTMIISVAALAGLVFGIVLVLLVERMDNGFRTDAELASETNIPCLGVLPQLTRTSKDDMAFCFEAARAIIAGTSLAIPARGSKSVLVTSSVPGEGKSLVSELLARTLVDTGRRALIIDLSLTGRQSGDSTEPGTLEEILAAIESGEPLPPPAQQFTTLRRVSGLRASHKLVTSAAFSTLLAQARKFYEVILIEAPAIMLIADSLYLARFSDLVLHVVRWRSTPRRTVAAALRRMRVLGIRFDGVILVGVAKAEHKRHSGLDAQLFSAVT